MTTPSRRPATSGQRWAAVVAVIASAVVVSNLAADWRSHHRGLLATGDSLALDSPGYNATATQITVPGALITVRVGAPVRQVDSRLVDLPLDSDLRDDDVVRAADGAQLVPLAWEVHADPGSTTQDLSAAPVSVRLVSGDSTVDLAEGTLGQVEGTRDGAAVHAVDAAGDATVVVDFDGATQSLDLSSGELTAGTSRGPVAPTQSIDTGCAGLRDRCHLSAVDPAARWRPEIGDVTFTLTDLRLYDYDADLGWAGDGRRWAEVSVQPLGVGGVISKEGGFRSVDRVGPLAITLDGATPRAAQGLRGGSSYSSQIGRVVFSVDDDTPARELRLERNLVHEGPESPRTIPVEATISLD